MTNPLNWAEPHAVPVFEAARFVVFRPGATGHDVGPSVALRVGASPRHGRGAWTRVFVLSLPGDPSLRLLHAHMGPDASLWGPIATQSPVLTGRTPRLLCARADCPHPPPGTRRGANVEPRGTEWGPAPPKIEQTTAERAGDPPLGREQASEDDGYLAIGDRLGHRAGIRGKAGATVHAASRTSDQDGPDTGHLNDRRARSERRPEDSSDGERTGPER